MQKKEKGRREKRKMRTADAGYEVQPSVFSQYPYRGKTEYGIWLFACRQLTS